MNLPLSDMLRVVGRNDNGDLLLAVESPDEEHVLDRLTEEAA